MIEHISVVIIAHNAEKTLPQTLASLKDFQEVIVYENGSNDRTKEVASSYQNVKLIEGSFEGFGKTKNKAASYASFDWILSLDSDEVLTNSFVEALKRRNLQENTLYMIHRTNYYKQTQVKHCWSDDFIIRLYNKKQTGFTDSDVHEHIIENDFKKVLLEGIIKHYPYNSIEEFVVKLNRYSTLFATQHAGKKSSSALKAFFNGGFSFFKTYILKQGFRDGYVGLVIAFSHMATNFYKYIKLYEVNKELKRD